jgi:hypothetical protein
MSVKNSAAAALSEDIVPECFPAAIAIHNTVKFT